MSDYHYLLFHGPDLSVDFGDNAHAALSYMAEHADDLFGADFALVVFDSKGLPAVALIDARS